MNAPDQQIRLTPEPENDSTHVVYVAVYRGNEYRIPVPVHLQNNPHDIQNYCRGYLRAAGVIRGESSNG